MIPEVAAAFRAFPDDAQSGLIRLRALIFDCAAELPETSGVVEALRWGQPAYLPARPRVGTTVRLGVPKTGGFALFTHCATSLISDFADAYPGLDRVDGNRGILFQHEDQIDPDRHGQLVRHALTYHLRKRCAT